MEGTIMEKLEYPYDTDWLIRKKKGIRQELLNRDIKWIDKRIAILGGSTTNDIQDFLEIFLLKEGIRPSFYASEYNKYWEDAMFDNPELVAFQPDLIYIHTSHHNITKWPSVSMSKEEVDEILTEQYNHFQMMWKHLAEKYKCPIIQNNFDRPLYRLLGNKDITDYRGWTNFVYRLNGMVYDYIDKCDNMYLHDIDYLSARYGLDAWQDVQHWNLYKYTMHLKAIPDFSYNLSRIIKSIYGKNKKTMVVDLDNTFWGGIVGDDGVENLVIGYETATGAAFSDFQVYLRRLKDMGILLAINSKNDESNALAGLAHPNSVLGKDDFACIKANWMSKDQNILAIAKELNLGTDSFVFLDDNPVERNIVRAQVPSVAVPDIESVENYCRIVDHAGYFEVTSLTADDLNRNAMYKANAEREQLQQSFEDYGAFLKSLEMRATIRDFEATYIPRIAQLTNKTNQFNLTTKRISEADMNDIAKDESYVRLYGRLEDKFGDNGIVSVVLGKRQNNILDIELWLMSCRVLKRDFEYAMFDAIVEESIKRNIGIIRGYYYPTAKNGMVKDFYNDLGFTKISEDTAENTVWEYDVKKHISKNNIIENIIR